MKLDRDGMIFFVVGGKRDFNNFNRDVGQYLENVDVRHLTDTKQLRGRTPREKKHFVIMSKDVPVFEKIADKGYSKINLDVLYKRVQKEQDKINSPENKMRYNAISWFRNNAMGEKVEPYESA
jgi:hypothetical protein